MVTALRGAPNGYEAEAPHPRTLGGLDPFEVGLHVDLPDGRVTAEVADADGRESHIHAIEEAPQGARVSGLADEDLVLDDVVTRVVPLVDARLTAGDLRAEALARVLAVSIRTLQRRLREAGLTLRGLVAQRRLRRAQALLAAGRSPSEAALGAGYAEASSLHRALRRAKVDLGHDDGVRSGSQGG